MKTKKDKLVEAFEYLRSLGKVRTQKGFAEQIKVNKTNLSSAFNGNERYLTDGLFESICEKYSFFNIDYFLKDSDEGYIFKEDAQNLQQDNGIPLIPFDFMAGFGEDNSGIKLNDCERYNIPEFENIGAEFLVRVGGSSMYPKYSSGDILA